MGILCLCRVDAGVGVETEVGVYIRGGISMGVLPEVGGADEQAASTKPARSRGPNITPRFIIGLFATFRIAIRLKSPYMGLIWDHE